MQFQGGIAKFDRHSKTFQTWSLPPDRNGPHVQINQVSPDRAHVDGKVWLQDAGTYTVLRLDVASGAFEVFEPYKIPRPNVYDVIPDSRNNGYFLVLGAEDVGRIDAKTGEIRIFKTPTPRSGPRRGMMDAQDRLWFGENNGDRIGMFDTRTERFQEWTVPTPGAWPYDVTADKNGNVWSGGEYNDRILRLDPVSGEFVEYLLPRSTNVRRVFVDNRTTPVTFWVGNNHGASIVKLEPLDAASPAPSTPATLFEGARLIAGDGRAPIENAAFVVQDGRFTQVGTKGGLRGARGCAPCGSHRQDGDAGARGRARASRLPQRSDLYGGELHVREPDRRARPLFVLRRRRGSRSRHRPGHPALSSPGAGALGGAPAHRGPRLCDAECRTGRADARRGVRRHDGGRGAARRAGARRQASGLHQDLGRRSERDRREAEAEPVSRDHRRSAHARHPRHGAHRRARGCEGSAACRRRRLRPCRSRQGHRPGAARDAARAAECVLRRDALGRAERDLRQEAVVAPGAVPPRHALRRRRSRS